MSSIQDDFKPITMEMSLDDIGDVPSFEKWPTGAYLIVLNDGITEREINDKNYLIATLTLLGDPAEVKLQGQQMMPKAGDTCDLMFDLTNPYGAVEYKKIASQVATVTGAQSIREINENSKGIQMLVVLQSLLNKKSSEEKGQDIYNIRVKMAALTA